MMKKHCVDCFQSIVFGEKYVSPFLCVRLLFYHYQTKLSLVTVVKYPIYSRLTLQPCCFSYEYMSEQNMHAL